MKTTKLFGTVLAVVTLVLANMSLYASEDYKSMIRYDRVWESLSQPSGDLLKCMRFDGTEEINGKSYHKIITFRKTRATYNTSILAYTYDLSEDVYESEGFIREEYGVVYTLVVEPKDKVENEPSGNLFVQGYDLKDDEILSEKIIYNFNIKEGDLFELYTFVAHQGGVESQFKVLKEDKIKIDGEECRSIEIAPLLSFNEGENRYGDSIEIIEGIGVSDYGSLNYHELRDHPSGLWHNNFLNRVFDNSGAVIYSSSSRYDSLLYDGFYKSMIRYDRVWESVCLEWGPHTVKYMKFDGKEEINGKVYDRIVTFGKTIFNRDSDYNDGYEFLENVYENEGYLREEDGKIYTLALGIKDKNYYNGRLYLSSDMTCPDDYELSEQLIYDFTLDEGSFYNAFSNVVTVGTLTDFKVKSKSHIIIEDVDYTKIGVSPCFNGQVYGAVYEIVESVGPIDHGCLNYNEFSDQPTRPWEYNYFNRLFDDNGNILYEAIDAMDYKLSPGAFSKVGTLNESPSMLLSNAHISFGEDNHLNAVKIYDLNGRLVKFLSGTGRITLSTADLTSGIYISVAETDGKPISRRKFTVK